LPPALVRCPGCGLHIYPQAKTCTHCQADLVALGKQQLEALKRAEAALARLSKVFG
jgi:hypothetical protein